MMHLRYIGQLEAYLEEEHAGQRHTITAILPREEVEEMAARLRVDVREIATVVAAFRDAVYKLCEHVRRGGDLSNTPGSPYSNMILAHIGVDSLLWDLPSPDRKEPATLCPPKEPQP